MSRLPDHYTVDQICARAARLDLRTPGAQKRIWAATSAAGNLYSIANPKPWPKPSESEKALEETISAVRRLRKQLADLHWLDLALVRREADQNLQDAKRRVIAAANHMSDDELIAASENWQSAASVPADQWIDKVTLSNLAELEVGLRVATEKTIAASSPGGGRPKNEAAYNVALWAARVYLELSGERPTFWNGGDTRFSIMLERLYSELGIKASLRKPAEWAMSKLDQKS